MVVTLLGIKSRDAKSSITSFWSSFLDAMKLEALIYHVHFDFICHTYQSLLKVISQNNKF